MQSKGKPHTADGLLSFGYGRHAFCCCCEAELGASSAGWFDRLKPEKMVILLQYLRDNLESLRLQMALGSRDPSFIEGALCKRVHWNIQDLADCAAKVEAAVCRAKGLDGGAVPQQALDIAKALQDVFKTWNAEKAAQAADVKDEGAAKVEAS
jgi:hypothetical protein